MKNAFFIFWHFYLLSHVCYVNITSCPTKLFNITLMPFRPSRYVSLRSSLLDMLIVLLPFLTNIAYVKMYVKYFEVMINITAY